MSKDNVVGSAIGTLLVIAGWLACIWGLLWLTGWLAPFGFGGGVTGGEVSGNEPPDRVIVEPESSTPEWSTVEDRWSCEWLPTMNENWHDDVLCTRGAEFTRPSLLIDHSYVTQEMMMQAATEHEARLNGE